MRLYNLKLHDAIILLNPPPLILASAPAPMINLFVLPKQAINITKTNSSSRYISVLKTAYTDASV